MPPHAPPPSLSTEESRLGEKDTDFRWYVCNPGSSLLVFAVIGASKFSLLPKPVSVVILSRVSKSVLINMLLISSYILGNYLSFSQVILMSCTEASGSLHAVTRKTDAEEKSQFLKSIRPKVH